MAIKYVSVLSCAQVPELVEDYMAGKTMLDDYITHNMKFDKVGLQPAFGPMQQNNTQIMIGFCSTLPLQPSVQQATLMQQCSHVVLLLCRSTRLLSCCTVVPVCGQS